MALRLNPADGRTWARAGWNDRGRLGGEDWLPLNDFLKDLAGRGPLSIGDDREAERRTYQAFSREVVEEAAEHGNRPLVIFDATSARDLWKYLQNPGWPKPPVFEALADADVDPILWESVRIVRVTPREAGMVAHRRYWPVEILDDSGAVSELTRLRVDTVQRRCWPASPRGTAGPATGLARVFLKRSNPSAGLASGTTCR